MNEKITSTATDVVVEIPHKVVVPRIALAAAGGVLVGVGATLLVQRFRNRNKVVIEPAKG